MTGSHPERRWWWTALAGTGVFVVGVALGSAISGADSGLPNDAALAAKPAQAGAAEVLLPALSPRRLHSVDGGTADPTGRSDHAEGEATETPTDLPSLLEALQRERGARERLGTELARLDASLARLTQRVEALSALEASSDPSQREGRAERGRPERLDADALEAIGFSPLRAERLAAAWGAERMALLELRHTARREGWTATDEYREAVRELNRGDGSLRGTLDEHEYDQLLYAAGRDNRVAVSEVIASSPAESIGLVAGDVITRYDGERVYSWSDLSAGQSAGEPDDAVTLEIDRDGELVEYRIRRGPIGVQLESLSVEP